MTETGSVNHNSPKVPDLHALTRALTSIFQQKGVAGEVAVLSREPSLYSSTFPAEILKCRLSDGTERQILGKYQTYNWALYGHGHRGGIAYEAEVYSKILQRTDVTTPEFFGVYTDSRTGQHWLFIEYLEKAYRVHKAGDPEDLVMCAEWLGNFHAQNVHRRPEANWEFLISYDHEYYQGWARRAVDLAGGLSERIPDLPDLCIEYAKSIDVLLHGPTTVIHGEFYPKNILMRDKMIFPVDWESAAIAAGEIDLASMTEGWPSDIVTRCREAYQRARWGNGVPEGSQIRLKAAEMYLQFRWLGDNAAWTHAESWRFGVLRKLVGDFRTYLE
jgi:hypothetical protein